MPVAHNIATNPPFACYHNTGGQSGYVLQPTERQWHSTSTTRYYAPSFEREITNGQTTDYTYIESPNGLIAAVKTTGTQHDAMLLATDHLGSIIGVWNASGTLLEEHRYTAWGLRTSSTATPRLRRGLTGHEHLQQFGLIDMQARLYDPHIGRFLAPDPYVQAPSMSMNFNRYAYCMNNPLKYVDPDGEFWHIVIGAVVGGVLNVVANLDNKDKMGFWDYAAAFAVGAGAGAVTAATGGAGAGFWATTGVAAACGAVTSATNSVISQTGKNFSGIENVKWGDVGFNAAVGGVSGAAGSIVGQWASGHFSLIINNFKISSPALSYGLNGLVGGAAAGAAAGFTSGYLMSGGDIEVGLKGLMNGMFSGAIVGTAAGLGKGYIYAKQNNINFFTGKQIDLIKKFNLGNTIERINNNERHPHRHDGSTFRNDKNVLPVQENGYCKEYVHPTPGIDGAGLQRIIIGNGGEIYYTPDHYETFYKIK